MESPITVTVSEDESRFASAVVKVLLIGVSVALGAALGWQVASGPRIDGRETAARARARALADAVRDHSMGTRSCIQGPLADTVRERSMETGSCIQGLTALGLDAEHGFAEQRHDPWGGRWRVRCHGALAVVQSDGADGRRGTADDVVAVAELPGH